MLSQNNKKIEQAILLIKKSDFAKAISLLEEIICHDSKDFRSYYLLGTLYLQLKKTDLAELNLRNALKLNNHMAEAMHNLGIILILKKNLIEAKDYFYKALQINPKNLQTLIELGRTHELLSNFEEAKQTFKKVLNIDPDNTIANSLLGSILLKNGFHSDGLKYLKKSSGLIKFQNENFIIVK